MSDTCPRQTYAQAIASWADRWPDREALVIGDRRVTFGRLRQDVDLVARNLRRLGLGHGDHIALLMGNSTDWITIYLAAATIGAVTIGINTRYKPAEIQYVLKQADVTALIAADKFLKIDFIEMLRGICPAIDGKLPDPDLPQLRTLIVFGEDVPAAALPASELFDPAAPALGPQNVSPDDIVLIQYTSGTTSFSKGVLLTHDSQLHCAWNVGRRLGLRPGDRHFSGRPFCHLGGLTVSLLTSLVAGACYVGASYFNAEESVRLLETERCTHTNGNDAIFLILLNHPGLDKSKLVMRGGWAAASEAVIEQVREKLGMEEVCAAYGISEAGGNVATGPYTEPLDKRVKGFAFPNEGYQSRIRNLDDGSVCPSGTVGEIMLKSRGMMKGYYKMPEQTAATFDKDGWLHTGDTGVMDEDGRLCFVGRTKDMLKVGGFNVAPAEVEDALHQHPAVAQASVVGVPDPRLTEVPAAYVILKPGSNATPEELIEFCKARIANFRVPRYVRIIDSFDGIQTTSSAKVQKNKLRAFALTDLGLAG